MFSKYTLNEKSNFGLIEVICGSMFSSKTKELIRRINLAKLAKFKTIVFKPSIDSRNKGNYITSHDNNKLKATSVIDENEIFNKANKHHIIGIDEAQFFSSYLVNVFNNLANSGKRIIVAGLDMDFKGKPFGPIPNLMATAEFVSKLHAICAKSGKMANYTHRKSKDKKHIKIGDENEYEAVSRICFFNKKNGY